MSKNYNNYKGNIVDEESTNFIINQIKKIIMNIQKMKNLLDYYKKNLMKNIKKKIWRLLNLKIMYRK